jgi:hypothetical protein
LNPQIKTISPYEAKKEEERLRRLPVTILVDFLSTLVSKTFHAYEDLKQKLPMQVKANYDPKDDEDSFTISTYKKNELLRAECDRLKWELTTMTTEVSNLRDQLATKEAEKELLNTKLSKIQAQHEEDIQKHQNL